jgi:hypothetical protein
MANQTLFCSEFCQQIAEFVRYARGVVRDPERADDPEVKEAIRIKMALLIGGGYPEKARRLNEEQRSAIMERDGGKCKQCGAPANEIDHIAGSSSDPSNLQLLCDPCHNAKTKSAFVPASEAQKAWANELWQTRIWVNQPVRLCDDKERWGSEWRTLKKDRGQRLWVVVEETTGQKGAAYKGVPWADVVAGLS